MGLVFDGGSMDGSCDDILGDGRLGTVRDAVVRNMVGLSMRVLGLGSMVRMRVRLVPGRQGGLPSYSFANHVFWS